MLLLLWENLNACMSLASNLPTFDCLVASGKDHPPIYFFDSHQWQSRSDIPRVHRLADGQHYGLAIINFGFCTTPSTINADSEWTVRKSIQQQRDYFSCGCKSKKSFRILFISYNLKIHERISSFEMVVISVSRSLEVLLRLLAVSVNLKRLLGSRVVFCGMVRSERSCVPQRRDCEKEASSTLPWRSKERHTFSSQRFLAGK